MNLQYFFGGNDFVETKKQDDTPSDFENHTTTLLV
jgi:hypothetical protein